ncbi:HNH endonuclease signature motif containing protein [Spelaeicoccus albus]|uniref:HNH nuclease domain-containing protein n=1 Tax=Spelaeicoccus albus TaxID=1280376 RepID=A0A7Z0IHX5_9MICO|nr:HNH endonuclease signature motif containing protein [Spelaeicoccus albus]NYI68015.1 hypothetical protein [Spelaeicoccus albus]
MEFDEQQAQRILAGLRRRLEPRDSRPSERWDVPGLARGRSEGPDGESSLGDADIEAAIDAVNLGSGIVREVPGNALTDQAVVQLLSDVAVARRRLDAAYLKVVALVDQRDAARDSGVGAQTTAGLLKAIAGVAPGRAKADVADARALHGEGAVSESVLVPGKSAPAGPLADMSDLLAKGRVSLAHIDTAVRTLNKVPEHLLDAAMNPGNEDDERGVAAAKSVRENICEFFAEKAPSTSPENLRRLGKHLVEVLDPDTDDHYDPESFNRRSMTMSTDITGMVFGTYQLDPAAGAALRAVLDPLSAPHPVQHGDDGSVAVRDTRTPEQRRADALSELASAAAPFVPRCHPNPDCRRDEEGVWGAEPGTGNTRAEARQAADQLFGLEKAATGNGAAQSEAASKLHPGRRPARITVMTTVDKFTGRDRTPSHCFQTGDIAPGTLTRLACDASFERLVMDARGAVLDLGVPVRLASPAQKRAISGRDKGCVFPGCNRPPSWCDVHHVQWYSRGGPTDVGNLCLLCAQHHSLIHSESWKLRMIDGVPYAKPEPGTIKVTVAGAEPTVLDTYSAGGDWVRNSYFDRLKDTEELGRSITRSTAVAT